MRIVLILLLLAIQGVQAAEYKSNKSCKECHEKIYDEYRMSAHSKGFFTDELHREVALKASPKRYECAVCHMPAANNMSDILSGNAFPDPSNVTHTDAVSCYFCHTIAYVKESHKFNINLPAKQAEGYKPSLFGSLKDPDHNDKHSALHSPIYRANACKGCHSHKLNDFNTTIFEAMKPGEDSKECIKCHMPMLPGGVEKLNHKNRTEHMSHRFLGIRDENFRKKGVDIAVTSKANTIMVTLVNKMPHPLIIQPARAKYLRVSVLRGDKKIWSNYKNSPEEDRKSYFAYIFKKNGKRINIPATATETIAHNLPAKGSLKLEYRVPSLESGDIVKVELILRLAKRDCSKVVTLKEYIWTEEQIIKSVEYKVP